MDRLAAERERGSALPLGVEAYVIYSTATSVPGPTPCSLSAGGEAQGSRTGKRREQQLKSISRPCKWLGIPGTPL